MSDSHEGKTSRLFVSMHRMSLGPVPTYNLFGISNHSGTLYSGHYIAQCRHPFTHQWHEFNDASVHRLNDDGRIVSANAYVLFYEQNKRWGCGSMRNFIFVFRLQINDCLNKKLRSFIFAFLLADTFDQRNDLQCTCVCVSALISDYLARLFYSSSFIVILWIIWKSVWKRASLDRAQSWGERERYLGTATRFIFVDDRRMLIMKSIFDHLNSTFQYLTSPERLLVSGPELFVLFLHSAVFIQILGDHVETTLVGFGLFIVVLLLYYLIRRSQTKTKCKLQWMPEENNRSKRLFL